MNNYSFDDTIGYLKQLISPFKKSHRIEALTKCVFISELFSLLNIIKHTFEHRVSTTEGRLSNLIRTGVTCYRDHGDCVRYTLQFTF